MAMAMAMAMGTSALSSSATTPSLSGPFYFALSCKRSCRRRSGGRRHAVSMMAAPPDAALMLQSVSDQDHQFVTWQIIAGAAAGIIPFVVAGIEFSKRIAAQRNCKVCKGSGLVKRDEYYFRCYRCGGFLPWQSWERFFSGK